MPLIGWSIALLISTVGFVKAVKTKYSTTKKNPPEGYEFVKIKKPYKYFAQRCDANAKERRSYKW